MVRAANLRWGEHLECGEHGIPVWLKQVSNALVASENDSSQTGHSRKKLRQFVGPPASSFTFSMLWAHAGVTVTCRRHERVSECVCR